MKNKILEYCYSFVAMYLFSCGLVAAIFLGIVLMPLVIVTLFILAIREVIVWKKGAKQLKQNHTPVIVQRRTAIFRSIPPYSNNKKAA